MVRKRTEIRWWRLGLICLLAALPAAADTQFRVRRMTRDDVPRGQGQCDIRLQIDGEAEVSVRGDTVYIRTIAGHDGRDDGSECNEPLPARDAEGFNYEIKDRRGEIRLLAPPSRRNGYTAIVRIRDPQSGEGRYHFRLTWQMTGGVERRYDGDDRPPYRSDRPDRGRFEWNESISFSGDGSGSYARSGERSRQLYDVSVTVERDRRVMVRFRTNQGPLAFTGELVSVEEGTLRADVVSGDRTEGLRGPMLITLDRRRQVSQLAMSGTAGRGDNFSLSWVRR